MEKEKVKFEVRQYVDDQKLLSKGIFINGDLFDWGVDEESYKDAMSMGPKYQRAIVADIERHFIASLSEFMNREVTREEVDEAMKTGWIDK